MGTFTQKIHCQAMPVTIAPPTTGPTATARPATPDHSPMARPRRSTGKASLSIVSESGVMIAPPSPWNARAMRSASMLVESAAPAEAAVKSASPPRKTRFRP